MIARRECHWAFVSRSRRPSGSGDPDQGGHVPHPSPGADRPVESPASISSKPSASNRYVVDIRAAAPRQGRVTASNDVEDGRTRRPEPGVEGCAHERTAPPVTRQPACCLWRGLPRPAASRTRRCPDSIDGRCLIPTPLPRAGRRVHGFARSARRLRRPWTRRPARGRQQVSAAAPPTVPTAPRLDLRPELRCPSPKSWRLVRAVAGGLDQQT
jgi:hypothetical protein